MTHYHRKKWSNLISTESKQKIDFWWDMNWEDDKLTSIVVESTHPKYPILARIPLRPHEFADDEIMQAEQLIKDIVEGRKNIREVGKEYNDRT